jgi:nucleoside-diphosphate-sugar epimerase
MQTILGAGGTIGSDLAKELLTYTANIRLVSRNPRKVNPGDELFPADLTDKKQVFASIKGSSVVYLVVGFDYNIKTWKEQWPALMQNVIDACRENNSKLVFFDNVYMYDPEKLGGMTEGTPYKPCSKKGEVRAKIAQMLLDEVRFGTLTALIARSADFYGPGNEKSVLLETVYKNLLKGKRANWFASVNKIHSFTFTPDAARATAMLGNTPEAYNQTWHLPTENTGLTGRDWIALFAKEMGREPKYMVIPKWMLGAMGLFVPMMRELHEMVYQYDRDYIFNSSKFEKHFSFRVTSPEEGVRQICKKAGVENMLQDQ